MNTNYARSIGAVLSIGTMLAIYSPALADDQFSPSVVLSGDRWECSNRGGILGLKYECVDQKTGEIYDSEEPIGNKSLELARQREDARSEETACYCSRQAVEGGTSPSGYDCTGAFAPSEMRKRPKDPCALPWPGSGVATGGISNE